MTDAELEMRLERLGDNPVAASRRNDRRTFHAQLAYSERGGSDASVGETVTP
jgi:hypothetical protein